MQLRLSQVINLFCILFFLQSCSSTPTAIQELVDLKPLKLTNAAGVQINIQDLQSANGLVIIAHSAECPIVRRYSARIEELQKQLADRLVNVVYVNTFDVGQKDIVTRFQIDFKVKTPIFFDEHSQVTHAMNLQKTSEAVFLKPNGQIIYRGAIDDSLDYEMGHPPSRNFLLEAVFANLDHQVNKPVYIPAKGCSIN